MAEAMRAQNDGKRSLRVGRRGFFQLAGAAGLLGAAPSWAQAPSEALAAASPEQLAGADRNTSDILVDALINWGATHVFGIVGDGINPIIEALRKRRAQIAFVGVRHEEAAAFMASGMSRPIF